LRKSTSEEILRLDPAANVESTSHPSKIKNILEVEEWPILFNTPCENPEIKRAALFTLYTGLKHSDVYKLDWSEVKGDYIRLNQQKTQEPLKIPLREEAIKLLGFRKSEGHMFAIPSPFSFIAVYFMLATTRDTTSTSQWQIIFNN